MLLVPLRPATAAARSTQLDRWFDDTLAHFLGDHADARQPLLDVVDSGESFVAQLDLPGVAKDAVKVRIDGRRVSVEVPAPPKAELPEGQRLLHRERRPQHWARSFSLPQEVDQTASSARMEDGVLTLTLTKRRAPTEGELSVQ